MTEADLSAPKPARYVTFALVALLHVVAILALIRAFAPGFTQQVTEEVLATFNVTVVTPSPTPTPTPTPKARESEGAAGEIGKRATPKEEAAPKARIPIAKRQAPPVAGKGDENASGARERGTGTGAGGQGSGTGSGAGGSGTGGGGGVATKAVKIAGDINSARDYPRATRDLRNGNSVTVALTVGTDGRVKGCRVHRPSPDAEADRITCQLAVQRFRFRPAMTADGAPVESVYGWQQRWWDPRERN